MLVFIVKYMFKVAVNVDVTTSQCERLSTVLNRLNNYLDLWKRTSGLNGLMCVDNKLKKRKSSKL